jgi:uncharacterized membrane protein (DUF2068 family)
MRPSERRMLRGIALFKMAKASALVILGIGALRLLNVDLADVVGHWVARIGLAPGSHDIGRALLQAAAITSPHIKAVGVGSFLYAGLFATEGIGLWLLKPWAEWMTIILTSSLVPFEVWELARRPGWVKLVVLLVNVGLVAYLVWVVRRDRTEHGKELVAPGRREGGFTAEDTEGTE